jgi:ribosome maturation factor RimP
MSTSDEIRRVVEPVLDAWDLYLYDLELVGRTLRVTVDRAGGVDLDTIGRVTRAVSAALDDHDPVPGGRYTLEVSSPGVERALRRPDHFARAVGTRVTVKTTPDTEGDRRIEGDLTAADDDGVTITLEDGGERRVPYGQIDKARTVFEWGPAASGKGSSPSGKAPKSRKRASTS